MTRLLRRADRLDSRRADPPSRPGAARAAQARSALPATVCAALAHVVAHLAVGAGPAAAAEQQMVVTVTAYNSVPEQTDEDPNTAAWGDELEPGMRVIAVSRDLLDIGLRRGSKVRIEGLQGEYMVLDKMHWRWSESIDVYMGNDVPAARRFGRQQRTVIFDTPDRQRAPVSPAAPAEPLDAVSEPLRLEASRAAGDDALPAVSAAPVPAAASGSAPTADFAPALLEAQTN